MSIGGVVIVAARLILLHSIDGSDIILNPDEVVSMRGPRADPKDKAFVDGVNCMINTSDGKYLSVRETCAEVMRIFVEQEKQP